jgi:hypothetical protein
MTARVFGRLILLLGIVFGTCGFDSVSDQMRARLESLPQHYSNFDVKMAWEVKAIGGNTVISGVIRNVRYAIMEDIEIWVTLLDANGKTTVHRGVDYVVPKRLDLNDIAAFSVELPAVAPHDAKLVFTYKYNVSDGGGDEGGSGGNWMQSFESKIP